MITKDYPWYFPFPSVLRRPKASPGSLWTTQTNVPSRPSFLIIQGLGTLCLHAHAQDLTSQLLSFSFISCPVTMVVAEVEVGPKTFLSASPFNHKWSGGIKQLEN